MKPINKEKMILLQKDNLKSFGIDILLTLVGAFMFALSLHFFTSPNKIAPGGVAGLATIINALTDLPIGAITTLINIPIMILGFFYLGKRFMLKTIISLGTFSLCMDYVLVNFPIYTEDKLVAAIFGGVLMGAGLGVIFSRGSSTGGTDIINKIIIKRVPHMKLGKITFLTDLVVVTISAFAFNSIEPALYALITLYISSIAIDAVLYGFNICKFIYIISDKADDLSQCINEEMHRGATILRSYGAYTKQDRPTVMVAVRQNEYYKLKKIVRALDPTAFMIVTSANEIVGAGFSKLDS